MLWPAISSNIVSLEIHLIVCCYKVSKTPLKYILIQCYLSGPAINRLQEWEGVSKSIRKVGRSKVLALVSQRLTLNWCDRSTMCYCICFLSQWFPSCYKLHGTVTSWKPRCQTAVLLRIYLFLIILKNILDSSQ